MPENRNNNGSATRSTARTTGTTMLIGGGVHGKEDAIGTMHGKVPSGLGITIRLYVVIT